LRNESQCTLDKYVFTTDFNIQINGFIFTHNY
jgi:hypothetical protein